MYKRFINGLLKGNAKEVSTKLSAESVCALGEIKIYKPIDGKLVLKETISGQDASNRTYDREMNKGKTAQVSRWRKQAIKPHVICPNCNTSFQKTANRKYCSDACSRMYYNNARLRYRDEKNKEKAKKAGN